MSHLTTFRLRNHKLSVLFVLLLMQVLRKAFAYNKWPGAVFFSCSSFPGLLYKTPLLHRLPSRSFSLFINSCSFLLFLPAFPYPSSISLIFITFHYFHHIPFTSNCHPKVVDSFQLRIPSFPNCNHQSPRSTTAINDHLEGFLLQIQELVDAPGIPVAPGNVRHPGIHRP